ncbi:hypothetical protein EYC80_003029 [Monilinia laxa]|uniref:Uncharacterized protein n=1 Tax=Monilinia laxa TaxID=61186 RepID=A0A5N6KCH8_MONLA|nr:hypothetical protein EYC80_003029 [Monilinia laxa]
MEPNKRDPPGQCQIAGGGRTTGKGTARLKSNRPTPYCENSYSSNHCIFSHLISLSFNICLVADFTDFTDFAYLVQYSIHYFRRQRKR